MHALYLTYVILVLVFFLLGKKYDMKWLQQGNYLFLAVVATFMFCYNSTDLAVAYFGGYLTEILEFIQSKARNSFLLYWAGMILIPALCMLNFSRRIRKSSRTQVALWGLISIGLIQAVYQQENLDVFLPFYQPETPAGPGWHTVISKALPPLYLLLTLGAGAVITTLLGRWLKRRSKSLYL